ncbi:DUF342 domain-containing protein [Anaeromicropila herbilytica]|uniref:Polymerase n=1 Tax=Anaeromicropila herbilytica TaxID=2785025 RepID=A0A7R7EMX2_9FIRM|nr:FapA family protein [Anaeromicropila herbilytica]BCN31505.1 polymerase [Anaeromicropila herbilytica]
MAYKHGYFKLILKDDGTYLIIYPAQNGGRNVTIEEINSYLGKVKNLDYDIVAINKELHVISNIVEVKLCNNVIEHVNEQVVIKISEDATKAIGRFYPPSNNGKLLSKDDIISELVHAGVKYGINEENIGKFLLNRQYCCNIPMANAKEVVEGKNANIEYFFKTDLTQKPKMNEDGTVDFHQLDVISHVNAGDILAKLTPADYGEAGMDILGRAIKQKKVIQKVLKHGKNIHLSEDKLVMYSEVSGHASVQDDKVFVSNTFEVAADVDTSTGDIEYDGNVTVKGNVISGYSIKAKGDIVVDGVVEGATLIAGGHIILKRGIQGMNRGSLTAEGNIVTKFIENSTVQAGGYLTTEAIMLSKVYAKGDITVGGKRGFVVGGEIKSSTMISVKTAGSVMGTVTKLEVGADPSHMEELHNLEKQLVELMTEKEKMVQILSLFKKKKDMGEKISPDKIEYIQASSKTNEYLNEKINEVKTRYQLLKSTLTSSGNGRIKIEGTVFPGVKIEISSNIYYIRNELTYCQFVREGAEIKVLALS